MLCLGKLVLVVYSPFCCLLAVVGYPADFLPVFPDMPQLVSQLLFPSQIPLPLILESDFLCGNAFTMTQILGRKPVTVKEYFQELLKSE